MSTNQPGPERAPRRPAGRGDRSAELEWICRSVLRQASPQFQEAEVEAVFYPYIGTSHTVRRKGSGWVFRISDYFRRAPAVVLESIATILVAKLLRRQAPPRMVEIYTQFEREPAVRESARVRRLARGRKRMASASGRHYSLSGIFARLNELYFGNRLQIDRLGWGTRMSWRRLAHYDPVHHSITISPVLDSANVPEMVLSYVVYHEMLHALFESTGAPVEARHHGAEFRAAERAFPDFARAKRFLAVYCRARGRSSKSIQL